MSAIRHVTVVGGGVVGLSTAYYLRRLGAEVAVLESNRFGSGASHGNAGWITPVLSAPLPAPGMVGVALRSLSDRDSPLYLSPTAAPRLAPWLFRFWRSCSSERYAAGLQATATLAEPTMRLFEELAADGVRFETAAHGLLFVCHDTGKAVGLLDALRPMEEHGYRLTGDVLEGDELRRVEPALGPDVVAGFQVDQEWAVRPDTLVQGLVARLRELDVELQEGAEVLGVDAAPGGPVRLRTAGGPLVTDAVVLAAGAWTTRLAASLGVRLPMEAGKGYSFSVVPKAMPTRSLYLVEAKVGCTPMGERLRLAGTMELSGVNLRLDTRRVDAIDRSARRYLLGWDPDSRDEEWTGMRPVPADGLPIMGPLRGHDRVWLNTGHSMLGVTLGPASGAAVAEALLRGTTEPLAPFRPDRFTRRPR